MTYEDKIADWLITYPKWWKQNGTAKKKNRRQTYFDSIHGLAKKMKNECVGWQNKMKSAGRREGGKSSPNVVPSAAQRLKRFIEISKTRSTIGNLIVGYILC